MWVLPVVNERNDDGDGESGRGRGEMSLSRSLEARRLLFD